MLCGKCAIHLPADGDVVICKGCDKTYHYGSKCAGISKQTWTSKSKDGKKQWRCLDCRELSKKDRENLRQSQSVSSVSSLGEIDDDQNDTDCFQQVDNLVEFRNLTSDEKLTMIFNKLQDLVKSQVFLAEQYEDNRKKADEQEKKMKELEQTVSDLSKTITSKDGVIKELTGRIAHIEQYSRNKNIEINGVIQKENENIIDVVSKVIAVLGVELGIDDIEVAHRIPTRHQDRPSPIIVQFLKRKIRDEILSRRQTHVITNDYVFKDNRIAGRIYVNESLSPFYKELFWKTKNYAKENNYTYVWFKNNKIKVRKSDGSNAITISDEDDLKKLR